MRQMLTRLPLKTVRRPMPPPETIRTDGRPAPDLLDRLEADFFAGAPA